MNRIRSRLYVTTLFILGATFALSEHVKAEIYTASRAQLAGLMPGHGLFIGRDGKMMEINLSAATAEHIVLPAARGQPDRAQYCAVDPTSHAVLIAILDGVSAQSRLSLYGFGNLKKPQWELPLNLFAIQVAWTGRKGEFYLDAVSLSHGRAPGARLILQDDNGAFSKHDVPRLKPVKEISQQQLDFNALPTSTVAFGATLQPDFESAREFKAISMGQSPYYHVYLCVARDWQIIRTWPADSAEAVAFSFDGQTILARYQAPTKEPLLEMANFNVKTGQIETCNWLPPDTFHLFCASDELDEAVIPVARSQRSTSSEFLKERDTLFADVPDTFHWGIARLSARHPLLLIRPCAEPFAKMFDFAAITTAPGEYWMTDGVSLWHLSSEGFVTKTELKIK